MNIKAPAKGPPDGEQQELTDEELENVTGGTFVKSWSTSGDADDRPTEEMAFYYAKLRFVP